MGGVCFCVQYSLFIEIHTVFLGTGNVLLRKRLFAGVDQAVTVALAVLVHFVLTHRRFW